MKSNPPARRRLQRPCIPTVHWLLSIIIRSNGISVSGATELAQALQFHNSTLVYLDLTGNDLIGSGGIESLAQVDQSKCIVKYDGQQ